MRDLCARSIVAILTVALCAAASRGAFARSFEVFRPLASADAFENDLRAVEGELERGLNELAAKEIATMEENVPEDASFAFGALAVRVAFASGALTSAEGRARVDARLDEIRAKVERDAPIETLAPTDLSQDALDYALALVQTRWRLGSLASELDAKEEAERWFDASFELAKKLAQTTPTDRARPFIYWAARATLARESDSSRFETAERFAAALAKSSKKELDAYYFYAKTLSIEIALDSQDASRAAELIASTLDDLKKVADRPDAPTEIAVALVSAEARAQLLEKNLDEAIRVVSSDSDLLGAPLPVDLKRNDRVFYDVFAERSFVRAQVYWTASEEAPEKEEELGASNVATRGELTAEARRASSQLRSAYWRVRASALARLVGAASDDWKTLEETAVDSYAAGALEAAIEGYDKASALALESGAEDDAFRLARSAAAIVDKICREEAFDGLNESSAEFWLASSVERFERLARTRLDDPDAPTFFDVSIERANALGRDVRDARFERLELFPEAQDRGRRAVSLARDAIADSEPKDAERALDFIGPNDPAFDDSIALERALAASSSRSRQETLARLLTRVGAEKLDADALSWSELARLLDGADLAEGAASCWEYFFELALDDSDALADEAFSSALASALARWKDATPETRAQTLATIRAYETSLALGRGDGADVARSLEGLTDASPSAALDALDRAVVFAEKAPGATRERLASFVLDALDELSAKLNEASTDRAAVVRADALRLSGRGQEALRIYASELKRSRKQLRVVRGLAELLASQKDAKALEKALGYWSDVADLVEVGSLEWWDAKERCVELYCRLGRPEQARKMASVLWLTRSDPSDPERRERWEKTISDAERR